jgi:hypothetical protein
MTTDTREEPDFVYCHHVVLFVDVLGQMEAMKGIDAIPTTPEERASFVRHLKTSAGNVDGIRKYIRGYVDSFLGAPKQPMHALLIRNSSGPMKRVAEDA